MAGSTWSERFDDADTEFDFGHLGNCCLTQLYWPKSFKDHLIGPAYGSAPVVGAAHGQVNNGKPNTQRAINGAAAGRSVML